MLLNTVATGIDALVFAFRVADKTGEESGRGGPRHALDGVGEHEPWNVGGVGAAAWSSEGCHNTTSPAFADNSRTRTGTP